MDRRKSKERFATGNNSGKSRTCRTTPLRRLPGAWPRRTGGWCYHRHQQRYPRHLEEDVLLLVMNVDLCTGHKGRVKKSPPPPLKNGNKYFFN